MAKAQQDARERARARRLAVDAERIARDQKVEDAAADYFAGADRIAELSAEIAQTEARMGQAIDRLIELGETQARVAALLEIPAPEVKRLKSKPAPTQRPAAETEPTGPDTDQPE